MNNETRESIAGKIAQLKEIHNKLEGLQAEFEELANDEEEKYDNLSEGLQASERGQALQEAMEWLQGVASDLEEMQESLADVIGRDLP